MLRLKNPLPAFLTDEASLLNFYREHNLVPYAGTTTGSAHSFLRLLFDLFDLSPSHGSCISDKAKWAFDGDIDFVESWVAGLKRPEEQAEIPDDTKIMVAESLAKSGLSLPQLGALTADLHRNYEVCGDAYLRYREIEIAGAKKVSLESLHPMKAMYLKTMRDEPRTLVISPDFFLGSWKTGNEVELVRVFPNYSEGDEYRETVFHVRNKRDYGDWYGKPPTLQVLNWMFSEWQTANLNAKISGSEVGAKAIITMEAEDPSIRLNDEQDDLRKVAADLRMLTTNRGQNHEMESMVVLEYPHGGKQPELLDLEINRDYRYFETTVRVASDYIFNAHGWSKILSGFSNPSGGIGSNILIDEFKVKNTGVIKPLQEKFAAFWKPVLNEIAEFIDLPELAGMGIRFEDRISSMIESFNNAENADPGEGSDPALPAEPGNSTFQYQRYTTS